MFSNNLTTGFQDETVCFKKDLGGNLSDWVTYQHNGPFSAGRSSNSMCVTIGVTDDNYGYIQTKGNCITTPGDLVLLPGGGNLYLHNTNESVITTSNISSQSVSSAATWATARTLTIGSTGKSVNGSGNVSWSLSEIGAAAASHSHSYLPLSGGTMTGSITLSQGSSARNVGIVGTYDYTKSAAIWAMGSSYQIPAAGNNLGSLYGAAYVYQGQAGQGTMAGGHQFVWAQNGGANVALGSNVWTSGGFIKNGSNDNYALTGGGGHFAIHTGRNNSANALVRTDGNGYIQCGYINSSSGDENNNSSPARVWGTNGSDSYLRTYRTSALSVNYANSAGSVAWSNVSDKMGADNWRQPLCYINGYTSDLPRLCLHIPSTHWANMSVDSNAYFHFRQTNSASGTYTNIYMGNAYASSDRHLKKNIQDIDRESLDELFEVCEKLFKKFTWKSSGKDSYGLIAQAIEKYIPEAVSESNDGSLSINYEVAYAKLLAMICHVLKTKYK